MPIHIIHVHPQFKKKCDSIINMNCNFGFFSYMAIYGHDTAYDMAYIQVWPIIIFQLKTK